jgi:hypothetical protein
MEPWRLLPIFSAHVLLDARCSMPAPSLSVVYTVFDPSGLMGDVGYTPPAIAASVSLLDGRCWVQVLGEEPESLDLPTASSSKTGKKAYARRWQRFQNPGVPAAAAEVGRP